MEDKITISKEQDKLTENLILIKKDEDGNWSGQMVRFGKLVNVREAKPEDVLTKLLTHDGR